jgi:hypothetical protein
MCHELINKSGIPKFNRMPFTKLFFLAIIRANCTMTDTVTLRQSIHITGPFVGVRVNARAISSNHEGSEWLRIVSVLNGIHQFLPVVNSARSRWHSPIPSVASYGVFVGVRDWTNHIISEMKASGTSITGDSWWPVWGWFDIDRYARKIHDIKKSFFFTTSTSKQVRQLERVLFNHATPE